MTDDLEKRFWSDCTRSLGEELKQISYLSRMGFPLVETWRSPFNYDAKGRSIIDIGGGPCSVLLKMENRGEEFLVVDPGDYPEWVDARYATAKIEVIGFPAEELLDRTWGHLRLNVAPYDLALIYNCLQHCADPQKVVANARVASDDRLAMFEWIDLEPHEGHPHKLTREALNEWTGRTGVVEEFRGENGLWGRGWYLAAL